jgi:MFS family permease
MPWGATTFVVPQLAGRAMASRGERAFGAGGLTLHAIALLWIALIARAGLPYAELIAPLMLSGCGFALAAPAIQNAVLRSVEPADMGKASGTMSTVRQLGGAFGVAILATAFASAGGYASAPAFSRGFAAAIAASGAIAALGALAAALLPGARRPAIDYRASRESGDRGRTRADRAGAHAPAVDPR